MKKFFLHTLFGLLIIASGVFGQEFPKTFTATSCANCTPPGYTIVSGGPVALSNMTGVGGSPLKDWVNNFSPPPSSFKALDANSGNVFLTLKYSASQQDKVRAYVGSGFEAGIKYTLHYFVMTSRAHLTAATISDYATSAKVEISAPNGQGTFTSVASKTTSFTAGVNVDEWVEQTLTFVAPTVDLRFELSSSGSSQGISYVNFDIYSKPFDCVVPGGQVELIRTTQSTIFSCETVNLYDLIKSPTPPGTLPVWSVNSNHGFTQMTYEEATHAKPSSSGEDYFVFFKSTNDCYNTDVSSSKVTFTSTPSQVALTSNQRSINCISQTGVDLMAQIVPSNYEVRWFTNDQHSGAPLSNPQAAPVGSYYAFYFNPQVNNCYSVGKAAVSAIFNVVGSTMCCNDPSDPSNQVPLLQTDVKIVAPAETYDLTKLVPANISLPPFTVLEWYTTADHSGSPVSDPQHAGPGKYYVFAHDLKNGCFNVPFSKSSVNVSKNAPQLSVRVALQGTFEYADGDIMRHDLQAYGNAGLLPVTTPYGGSEVCADINDYSKMGGIVDWIKLEIRDATNPSMLLESKSLLLKSTGAIVNLDGTSYPYFKSQSQPVRVVIKHRNHLAIMSNPIQNFGIGVISYDFTTALSQASNESGDPAQMVQRNGIWCLQLGDLNASQDFAIDGSDGTDFKIQFKEGVFDAYDPADVNMDGVVDGLDGSLFKINFLLGLYSSIINY